MCTRLRLAVWMSTAQPQTQEPAPARQTHTPAAATRMRALLGVPPAPIRACVGVVYVNEQWLGFRRAEFGTIYQAARPLCCVVRPYTHSALLLLSKCIIQ